MSRRGASETRCKRCRMNDGLCICAAIPDLSIRTRLVQLIHRRERSKPTNTGRLALLAAGGDVLVHGVRDHHLACPDFANTDPMVLFPGPTARPLAPRRPGERPVTLIVPDGTWPQTRRMFRQLPWLARLPQVTVPEDAQALPLRLRYSGRPQAMHTGEAIAHALGILEGPAIRDALRHALRLMMERVLYCRGELALDQLT